MRIKANNIKEPSDLQDKANKEEAVEAKLDELIALLAEHEFDSETVKHLQQRFNAAVESNPLNPEALDAFKVIDEKNDASRAELLEEFSSLLLTNKIDSNISSRYLKGARLNKAVLMIISIVMITLGFAMIIMPAPPYFEMFTIYYFTPNDGVTLMDLISLVIIFAGVYILIRSLYQKTPMSK